MVSGSRIGSMPVSSRAVVTQIALDPDMAWHLSGCMTMKAASAEGSVGGRRRLTEALGPPRGSRTQKRRRPSPSPFIQCSFSSMVAPGTSSTPPVTIRPISPSAWTPRRLRVRLQRIASSTPCLPFHPSLYPPEPRQKPEPAMRLLIAIFLPFLLFFTIGRPIAGIICLVLQITLIGWIPAALWAIYALSQWNTDRKIGAMQRGT